VKVRWARCCCEPEPGWMVTHTPHQVPPRNLIPRPRPVDGYTMVIINVISTQTASLSALALASSYACQRRRTRSSMPRPPLPPYLTSGASSRAHHSLLVRLHDAISTQDEHSAIAAELDRCKLVLGVKNQSTVSDSRSGGSDGLWNGVCVCVVLIQLE
jgi:hypothetical protein